MSSNSFCTHTVLNTQSWANNSNPRDREGLLWDRNQVTSSAVFSLMLLPWILATHQFFMTGVLCDGNPFCFPPSPKQYSWQIRLGTKNSCLGPVFVCFVSAFWKACVTAWKKQITFNSFLRDGSGGCEAQLQNTNRLNQTSRIINKHKPNCSFLTGPKGRRKQPGCDCPPLTLLLI